MLGPRGTRTGLLIAALLLCAHSLATAQRKSAPRQRPAADILVWTFSRGTWSYELRGDVRSLETVTVRLEEKDGQERETYSLSTTYYFDGRGFETEMIDDKGGRSFNKFDAQGKLLEVSASKAGVPEMRYVYHYDLAHRKVTTEMYYYGKDGLYSRDVALYDKHWNETRGESETVRNNVDAPPIKDVQIFNNTYDAQGRLTGLTVGREGRHTSYSSVDEYDASNHLVKSTHGVYSETTGALNYKSLMSYDRRGLLTSVLRYDARGKLIRRDTYTREFDAHGNWISERHASSSTDEARSFTFITRRKITYY